MKKIITFFFTIQLGCFASAEFTVGGSPAQLDGEVINPRTGELYWETRDIFIPGQGGMNVEIYRSFAKEVHKSFTLMRNWELELPRIVIPANILGETEGGVSTGSGLCNAPYPKSIPVDTYTENYSSSSSPVPPRMGPVGIQVSYQERSNRWLRFWGHPREVQLIIPGQKVRNLVPKSAEADEFGGNVRYVTADNWTAECVVTPNTIGRLDGFKVTSPEGVVYIFDQIARSRGSTGANPNSTDNTVFVTRVTDASNNWLEYEYYLQRWVVAAKPFSNPASWIPGQDYFHRPSGVFPRRIRSADGIEVLFHYEKVNTSNYFLIPNEPEPPISRITTNVGQEWRYNYGDDVGGDFPSSVGILNSVSGPEGLMWVYRYDNAPVITARYRRSYESFLASKGREAINHIRSVTTPTGAIVTYTYDSFPANYWGGNNNGSTVLNVFPIRTRTITGPGITSGIWTYLKGKDENYTYLELQGPTSIIQYTHYLDFNAWNHGLLKSVKVFPPGMTDPQTRIPTRSEDYVWFDHKQIGSLLNNITDDFLPKSVEHRARLQSKTVNGQFVTTYSDFTDFGSPQMVTESGTAGRTTYLTYFNNPAAGIIDLLENTDTNGFIIDRTYNDKGLPTRINEYGIVQSYDYYPNGDLRSREWTTDGATYSVTYQDYHRGVARLESWPGGLTITREVNDSGTVSREKDFRGYFTNFEYDGLNRLTDIIPPAGHSPISIDWPSFTQKQTTFGVGSTKQMQETITYTGLGQVASVIRRDLNGPLAIYQSNAYDEGGRLTFEGYLSDIATEGFGKVIAYDELDRVINIQSTSDVSSENTLTTFCYAPGCPDANLTHGVYAVDDRGYVTKEVHRSYGEPEQRQLMSLVQQEKSLAIDGTNKDRVTSFERSVMGDIAEITQGDITRTYTYYPGTRLVHTASHPEAGLRTYSYDGSGNLKTSQVDGSGVTVYSYDAYNRVDFINYPGATPDIDYQYDANGNVLALIAGNNRWDYKYNALDKLYEETLTIGALANPQHQFTMVYDFDGLENIERITYPSSRVIDLNPDVFGRPTSISDYLTSVNYYPNGVPRQLMYANGVLHANTLTGRKFPKRMDAGGIMSLEYAYDGADNITGIENELDASLTKSMAYDGLERLAGLTSSGQNAAFFYDEADNITSKTIAGETYIYAYDPVRNRLEGIINSYHVFDYDSYGNVTGNGWYSFAYDDAGNMRSAGSAADSYTYDYDGHGHRVSASSLNGTVLFFYSHNGLLRFQKDLENDMFTEYVYLGSSLIASTKGCADGRDIADCEATPPVPPVAPGDIAGCTIESNGQIRLDSDCDGMPNYFESQFAGLDPQVNDAALDSDADGLSNLLEFQLGSNPEDRDSDNDGIPDNYEYTHGMSVIVADQDEDFDNDSFTNLQEYLAGTDINNPDTDGDGIADGIDNIPTFDNESLIILINNIISD